VFVPGIELCCRFHQECVRSLLASRFPGVPYAAALLGFGSEVLGFDTEMSTDHEWGPRVQVFLPREHAGAVESIAAALREGLPSSFAGYAVRSDFVGTLARFVRDHLAFDVDWPIEVVDWLTFPSQILRSMTAGAVYRDDTGEVGVLRERLAWYPHDVWLYLMAAGWQRIGQEEHLMPRAGMVGDELGSALIGSRLVRDAMSLAFLMERQYAPYPKWFGTAFARLESAPRLLPALGRAQAAVGWQERGAALCDAFETLAAMHNALGVSAPMPAGVVPFHDRPFRVIEGEARARALLDRITDPDVRRLASRRPIGGIDQISDSTDLRAGVSWRAGLRRLYH
jgi:hypothetical protein